MRPVRGDDLQVHGFQGFLGFRVQGFRGSGLFGFSGLRVQGSGFRVQGFGFSV